MLLGTDSDSLPLQSSLAPAVRFLHTRRMLYRLSADLVVVLHMCFVLFVLFGGLLLLKWPRLMWLHVPAVTWGAFVEFSGWICPLTPLENWLRTQAGQAGYTGDFIARYLSIILYPEALTREIQVFLGSLVVAINLAIYSRLCITTNGITIKRSLIDRVTAIRSWITRRGPRR